MSNQRLQCGLLAAIAAVAACTQPVKADEILGSATTEYTRRIKVGETIQPLGETPFGESVSLYTGALSFSQTDIHLPGIGPDITLTRKYEISGSPLTKTFDMPMADWDLAVPEITTLVPTKKLFEVGTWRVNTPNATTARCSRITMVSQAPYYYGLPWWHGYQLVTGDGHSQPLLKRTAENANAPGGNVAAFPLVTPGNWVLGCLSATSNGEEGEAFLGVAPDGTRYWFDYLAWGPRVDTLVEAIPWTNDPSTPIPRDAATSTESLSMTGVGTTPESDPNVYWGVDNPHVYRRVGHMFATRVEDRFGNWVTYRYSGEKLQEINASDGRRVLVAWRTDAPLVDRITIMPGTPSERVWIYDYVAPTDPLNRALVSVRQPDNTSWSFAMGKASIVKTPSVDLEGLCGTRTFTQIAADDNVAAVSITHPTGLHGDFLLSLRARARSWVPTSCTLASGSTGSYSETLPPVYLSLALTSKTFLGPGIAPRTWSYLYSNARGSTASECMADACQDWQWVEVTDPEQQTTHYRFSTRWGFLEGKLLAKIDGVVQRGTDDPVGLQRETYAYADPGMAWTFPARWGDSIQDTAAYSNNEPTERPGLEIRRERLLQDVRFQREVLSFDRYGQAETVRRASVPGDSQVQTTSYWPVDSQWVLGQAWKTTQEGRVIGQTDYDAKVLPLRTYAFGLLQATYGYAPNGMMTTITDPRGNVTTLSDHKRGIPQLIRFADLTTIAPSVDDLGQVTAVRNQLSDSTTYRYDAMGRLEQTGFPSNDTVAWNPVNRSFRRIGFAQFGLPEGHWQQEIRTGNALTTTLYDAMWLPRVIMTEDTATSNSRSYVVKRYDADGRETFSSYPVDVAPTVDTALDGTHTLYDALGRVVSIQQESELGLLSTYKEYLPGYRTRVTNPRGFATTTSFQTFDEPSEEAPTRIEAPQGVTTVIARDAFGKPLSITRSGPSL